MNQKNITKQKETLDLRHSIIKMTAVVFLMLSISLPCVRLSADDEEPDADQIANQAKTVAQETPEWVTRGSYKEGEIFFVLVKTEGGHISILEADEAIIPACNATIGKTLTTFLSDQAAEKVCLSEQYIKENLIADNRTIVLPQIDAAASEVQERFGGEKIEFYRGYALLKFDNAFRKFANEQWRDEQTRSRLIYSGVIGATIFGLLTLLFSYLKLDSATRGFHTTRLQTFFVAAILVMVALVIWATQKCEWL